MLTKGGEVKMGVRKAEERQELPNQGRLMEQSRVLPGVAPLTPAGIGARISEVPDAKKL